MTNDERELLQTEIQKLQSSLSSNTSEIGDYRIIKIYEARLNGSKDPYDAAKLIADREATRKKINDLRAELEKANDNS
ncbi:hypothetical protein [Megasphaera sp.]|uniref:hypothetical protein n=1 Tax=Megasphaera sp. TaxID=2023260 RepID=UPI003521CA21